MVYHSWFPLSVICLVLAFCMSMWWYATTGDNRFVKLTIRVGCGIVLATIAVIAINSLFYLFG